MTRGDDLELDGIRVIALDAMGVLYQAADDVAELLVPFVSERGGARAEVVRDAYVAASRGALSAAGFWRRAGVDPGLEDVYLERHALAPDVPAFLAWASGRRYRLACLSNDVAEWSVKLRRRFGLERYVADWVISGDVGARKPERAIYDALLARLGAAPREVLLVDDWGVNVDAAQAVGMRGLVLDRAQRGRAVRTIGSLTDLADRLITP